MKKEEFFISLFNSKYIGDDGAVLGDVVFSKDLFCEDIHFKRDWMDLCEIARKSMLVNISDAIVMNAKPLYALIGIVVPKNFTKRELRELSEGFIKSAEEFDLEIVGGDTVSGNKLMISVTVVSKVKRAVFRTGLKEGYLFAYTSSLGNVSKDLKRLLRGGRVGLNSRFRKPILRADFFYEVSKHIAVASDISDGLSKDLSRILNLNSLGVKFLKRLDKSILCSGEEYEILFAFDRKKFSKIASIAKKYRVGITPFAVVTRGKYKTVCKENHF